MNSVKTNKGFSIIEIMIVLGIFSLIMGTGLFISTNSFENHYFISEEKLTASLLRAARSRALNNFNQSPHGLLISNNEFILFEGNNFNPENNDNENFPRNKSVEITSDFENENDETIVVFENLTGRASPDEGSIFLKNKTSSSTIRIFYEGRIEY